MLLKWWGDLNSITKGKQWSCLKWENRKKKKKESNEWSQFTILPFMDVVWLIKFGISFVEIRSSSLKLKMDLLDWWSHKVLAIKKNYNFTYSSVCEVEIWSFKDSAQEAAKGGLWIKRLLMGPDCKIGEAPLNAPHYAFVWDMVKWRG